MEDLSKQEELILLAVWRLQNEAYGIPIRKYLKEVTGKKISIGGIYVPLDRLVRKGFLESHQGTPTPQRGGMSKHTVVRCRPAGTRWAPGGMSWCYRDVAPLGL